MNLYRNSRHVSFERSVQTHSISQIESERSFSLIVFHCSGKAVAITVGAIRRRTRIEKMPVCYCWCWMKMLNLIFKVNEFPSNYGAWIFHDWRVISKRASLTSSCHQHFTKIGNFPAYSRDSIGIFMNFCE